MHVCRMNIGARRINTCHINPCAGFRGELPLAWCIFPDVRRKAIGSPDLGMDILGVA